MINPQMMANNMRQNMQPMHRPMGQHMGGYDATPQGYAQQHGNPFVNSMFGGGLGSMMQPGGNPPAPYMGGGNPPPPYFGGGMGQFAQNNPQFAQQLLDSLKMGGAGNSGAGMPPQAVQDAYNTYNQGQLQQTAQQGFNQQQAAQNAYDQFRQQQTVAPMNGAQTAQMNPMGNMNGAMGAMAGAAGFGRPQRATGGRAKGKTNVNIIISPQSGQQGPMGAGVGMGMPPMPPQMPPMPPQGMPPMPPGGGAPGGAPQLPPQLMAAMAAQGGAGGPPMPRKTGGRVENVMPKYQEKEFGSGSGRGRLEKIKWPFADGTE
jgi:hypothetical protein